MTWRRKADYHGSRTYESGIETDTVGGKIRRITGLCVAWGKHQIKTTLSSGIAPVTDTRSLITANQRGFSLLGSKRPTTPRHDD